MLSLIIEPAISLALFYLAYVIFLQKLTFFRANRYFLLAAVIFSMLLPHINFTPPVTVANYSNLIPEVTVYSQAPSGPVRPEPGPLSAARALMVAYIAGVALLALRLIVRLTHLALLISRNTTRRYKNAIIVNLNSEQAPFSFLNYIFINESLYGDEEKQNIIDHELVHISQAHTFDLMLLELLTIVQWFNPVAWLYRRSILEIHEYLADEEIIKKGTNISFYQSLLLNLQLGREYFSPASNFNRSLTLNRIRMMTSIKPAAWKRIGFYILVPLLVFVVLMCTKEEEEITYAASEPVTERYIIDNEADRGTAGIAAENMAGAGDAPMIPSEDGGNGVPNITGSMEEPPGYDIIPSSNISAGPGYETGTSQATPETGNIAPPVSNDNTVSPGTEDRGDLFDQYYGPANDDNTESPGTAGISRERDGQSEPPAGFPDPPHPSPGESEIFFIVEDMPDFQGGGQDAFRKYIAENLRYPQAAAENGIEGRVFVQFTVMSDGTVENATIVRGIDPTLDREALRVVMSSPRWTPGRQRGQPVNVAFTFPINFVLQ